MCMQTSVATIAQPAVSWASPAVLQANASMEREMLEQQLAALQVEVSTLRGRLGAATAQLCAAATPSNPALMAVLKVPG
jgi:hypothetical protein